LALAVALSLARTRSKSRLFSQGQGKGKDLVIRGQCEGQNFHEVSSRHSRILEAKARPRGQDCLYCQLRTRLLQKYKPSNVKNRLLVQSNVRRIINCDVARQNSTTNSLHHSHIPPTAIISINRKHRKSKIEK